ncbi:50S ribosomal protein L44e [Candidatus Woesearchaeota archaeon]|nr:50S ribosomal protein L44e [Candidatus Woesearchaeota archaeon]
MKMPKQMKRFCKFCRKHTQQVVSQVKKGKPSSLSYGSKIRAAKRGVARGFGGLGRYSKPAVTKWKMTGKKATKKTDLRYVCQECKKATPQKKGFRTKKLEFV